MQIAIQTEKKLTKPASQPCCSPSLAFTTPQTSIQACVWSAEVFHDQLTACSPCVLRFGDVGSRGSELW